MVDGANRWRTGLWVSKTLDIDVERFAGNGEGVKFSSDRSLQSFRFGEVEIPSEVVAPADEG